jgi:hypothetical protein
MTPKQAAYIRVLARKLHLASDRRDLEKFVERCERVPNEMTRWQASKLIENLKRGAQSTHEIYKETF